MITLDEAWRWYESTRAHLALFSRLASKHWDRLPDESSVFSDDKFKSLESIGLETEIGFCLGHLDDLAVLVLFSTFEAVVREETLRDMSRERLNIRHDLLRRLVDDAMDGVENGSFATVLAVYKVRNAELVEQVNQVRRYRNWVAHGRRSGSRPPDKVSPQSAYRRLDEFLRTAFPIESAEF